jgi:hypothetical protein
MAIQDILADAPTHGTGNLTASYMAYIVSLSPLHSPMKLSQETEKTGSQQE